MTADLTVSADDVALEKAVPGGGLLVVRDFDVVDGDLSEALFALHLDSFGLLRERSAMRYVYTWTEWAGFMLDPRIRKWVAWIDGSPVGVMTAALDLGAVPWLSREYCAQRFPGRTVFYKFDTIVGEHGRGTRTVQALFEAGLEFARKNDAVILFSVAQYEIDRHFIELIQRSVTRHADATIGEVDAHRYFAFDSASADRAEAAWRPERPAVGLRAASYRDLEPGILRQRAVIEGHRSKPITAIEIQDYLSELSNVIGMTTLLPPVTHRSDTYGWAGWIHWETSGAHFYAWEDPIFFSVDIYTCKAFSVEEAIAFTRSQLRATDLVHLSVG